MLSGARPRVLVLSPHPDDVALSVGGLVRLLRPEVRLTIVSVFTRSVAAPLVPRPARSPALVSDRRKSEDRAYCQKIGAHLADLDYPDVSLRGYPRGEWLGEPSGDDAVAAEVTARLRAMIAGEPAMLLAPLAIGSHVDHLIVRRALTSLASGVKLGFYEDLPYAAELGVRTPAPLVAALGLPLVPAVVDVERVFDEKLDDIRGYLTQTRDCDLQSVREHATCVAADHRLPALAERLWLSPALVATAPPMLREGLQPTSRQGAIDVRAH
jgi:LmbE family N-acetylglucosaminyl deacetylase